MAIISYRCFHNLVIAQVGTLLAFGSVCSAQQVASSISSNLEQTAATTSTRRSLSPGSGPIALPNDFTKLRLDTGYSVELEVFGVPEMNCSLRVDDEGNVYVPLVGIVHVGWRHASSG